MRHEMKASKTLRSGMWCRLQKQSSFASRLAITYETAVVRETLVDLF